MKIVPILPKNTSRLGAAKYQQALEAALDKAARAAVEDIKATVRTWSNAPTPQVKKRAFERDVTIDDQRWHWLDEGTKPHIIRPRRARVLRFAASYRAKTTPGRLQSGSGGPSGPIVTARMVRHPGIKARNWSQRLQAENQERVSKLCREAIHDVSNG